jgi:threonine dehydratase
MIAAREALGLATKIVGVVAENAPAYALSYEAGRPIVTHSATTIADGMACQVPEPQAVEIINRYADRVVRVSDEEIKAAMRHYFSDTHNAAEGAGAAPLAALLKESEVMRGRRVGLVLSGGNVDRLLFAEILRSDGPYD